MNEIVNECGKFFELDKPLIPDVDWLPYTTDVLIATLKWKEQQLCDIANMYVAETIAGVVLFSPF